MQDNHPTLLYTPEPPTSMQRHHRFQWSTKNILPLAPDAYVVRESGALWQVRVKETLALVYAGPGPVEVVRSPAPF